MGTTDNFCLKWNDFQANISSSFKELREDKEFFDVTLCCDEGTTQLQAHKVILAACSPFFRKILTRNPHEKPLIYLKGIDYANLVAVLNFMYHGEVNIAQDELSSFLKVAEELSVKGLTDGKKNNSDQKHQEVKPTPARASSSLPSLMKRPPPLTLAGARNPSSANKGAMKQSNSMPPMKRKKNEIVTEDSLDADEDAEVIVDPKLEISTDELGDHSVNEDFEGYEQFGEGSSGGMEYLADDTELIVDEGESPQLQAAIKEGETKATIEDFVMRNEHGTYWCKGCGHHSSSKRDLSRHIEARHIGGDYRCKYCNKSLTTKYNLQRHINKNHKPKGDNSTPQSKTNSHEEHFLSQLQTN